MDIVAHIAGELSVSTSKIRAAVDLLDEGATVPFIARYRKEVTGGLDDAQLRTLSERLQYLRELEERKTTVIKSIEEQGKMTDSLRQSIEQTHNKTTLEDLYLPYKPKRRTKAQIAREAGLEPLAFLLLNHPQRLPVESAKDFINAQITDEQAALDGARAILMEYFAEDANLLGSLREKLWNHGQITTQVIEGKQEEGAKFRDYFNHHEAIHTMAGHRALAVFRAASEGIVRMSLPYKEEGTPSSQLSDYEEKIIRHFNISDHNRPADKWLIDSARLAWRAKIFPALENDLLTRLKEKADQEAVHVFSQNLKDLLLAAPAGRQCAMGLDPGIRTGVKVAVVDDTGKLLDSATIYPFAPKNAVEESLFTLEKLITRHGVRLIAIGNGTAGRETDALAGELIKRLPVEIQPRKVMVSEAGASVYSASELASCEFPDLDVSLRGAVSIARRLQDPLAELVKIDPKSIGVGQYQHDVNQTHLAQSLDAAVEDCVNAVGVDVNTASVSLLTRISGLNKTLAQNIVDYRNENGAFDNRKNLLKVPRLGAKTFEQSAGFLRIHNGSEPLDASAVHPEAYGIVRNILKSKGLSLGELIGNTEKLAQIRAADFCEGDFGLPTILDILSELDKPGRDPRGEFKTAQFNEQVREIKDLAIGMTLEGVVSNVANFGAFVDIGVHQDGLVHISEMAERFVSDPRQVVKAGDIVRVRVTDVDIARKRIALSMRTEQRSATKSNPPAPKTQPSNNTAMAAAFAKLKK